MNHIKTFFVSVFVLLTFCVATNVSASCVFTRDLEIEDEGEDVRCLQQFLNNSGYQISNTGAGSPGKETNTLKKLTKEAIKKWQKDNNLSATGLFGPLSRQKYKELLVGNTNAPSSTASVNTVSDVSMSLAKSALTRAINQLEDSESEVEDSSNGGSRITQANKDLVSARDRVLKAMKSYIAGDYKKTKSYADEAFGDAEDALQAAGGETEGDKINKKIKDIDKGLDKVDDKIGIADDRGKDITNATRLLKDARSLLNDAEDKLDVRDYVNAEFIANKAKTKGEDAEDAINDGGDESDAKDAINQAKSAISEAKSDISVADKKNRDTDEAVSLLKNAESYLDTARTKFDDGKYSDAESLAQKAERKAEDASNAL